ncbi:hypothetical protein RirG_008320 [Rhizophagus irregularis DAOM 197198w]|uniref:Uncharacterized protein n=1 Tax=Rhizophagus irregularis (strain DAOM 197198w) TaxID=1432141 RepID=A0A015M2G4_RHIIW|nr:hypothetical protein RirG_008320 [Rhizophagus irregularis DAOM 197198w]
MTTTITTTATDTTEIAGKTLMKGTEDLTSKANADGADAIERTTEIYKKRKGESVEGDEEETRKGDENLLITNKKTKTKNKKIYENQKHKENKREKNSKNKLKIGCINVRGLNDTKKQGDIRKFLYSYCDFLYHCRCRSHENCVC